MNPLIIGNFFNLQEVDSLPHFINKIANPAINHEATHIDIMSSPIPEAPQITPPPSAGAAADERVTTPSLTPDVRHILLSTKQIQLEEPYIINRQSATINFIVRDNPYDAFIDTLKTIDPNTPTLDLMLLSHGEIIGGKHFIAFQQGDDPRSKCLVSTENIFNKIKEIIPNTKINILMDSCFSGMAHKDTNILAEGSTLWTTSDPSTMVATKPLHNALKHYDLENYDHIEFIKFMLLNRKSYEGHDAHPTVTDFPNLMHDMVMRSVSGGPIVTYQLSDLAEALVHLKAPLLKLKDALGEKNPEFLHFIKDLSQCKADKFSPSAISIFTSQYEEFLSFLALEMNHTQEYNPNVALPFVNHYVETTAKLSYSDYARIFFGSEPGKNSILTLLNTYSDTISSCAHHLDQDPLIDSMLMDLFDAQDTPEFVDIRIACDIVPRHHTDESKHVFRVVFISDTHESKYHIIEVPLDETIASGLLNGEYHNIYELLKSLAPSHSQEITKEVIDKLALMISNPEISEQLKDACNAAAGAIDKQLSDAPDPLSQKICTILDTNIKALASQHQVPAAECTTLLEYLHAAASNNATEYDLPIVGSNGELFVH